jgi:hypothetical protein
VAAKSVRAGEMRRLQRQNERNQSPPLRTAFPAIGQLRIELNFRDRPPRTPAPQLHTLFPSANAFFRFACPCAECDGEFDLTTAIKTLAASGSRKGTARDHLVCQGVRLRDRISSQPCVVELDFQVTISAAPALV